MGAVSRILITGAGGFIGRATVAEARARGLGVVAVVRRAAPSDWAEDAGIEVVTADLSDPASVDALAGGLRGCGAVIHAAAHLGGDPAAIEADTLRGTRHLLDALPEGMRLVLVSSVAIYDPMRRAPGETLDERARLSAEGQAQDPYSGAKLAQEALCRASGHPLWLMRPGAVWGPGRTWHALSGFWVGPCHVLLDSDGELPLVHVTSVARALVSAALRDPEGTVALNVIDDDRPTRRRFARAHRRAAGWPRLILPLPWTLWRGLARLSAPLGPRRPGLLREPVLRARIMPLSWPNAALRQTLGGSDDAPFEEMLARSLAEERR